MAQFARVVVPGVPHHVTQRGNRRQQTFFRDEDYRTYVLLMAEWCRRHEVEIWAYCLMPNHVHLIAVPRSEDGLRRSIGEAHRRYTRRINSREGWRGHLWQGRFSSHAMDDRHLLLAARYVELNPVRAMLAGSPAEYLWSSAPAHMTGKDDPLVKVAPLLDRVGNWGGFLGEGLSQEQLKKLRLHGRTGKPLGDDEFVMRLERLTGRVLRAKRRGPKGPRKRKREN